jgi:uncharacterized protein (TIGR03086 family)
MAWKPGEAYLRGIDFFDAIVDQVPADAWQAPSPCAGWRAIDVLGHVGVATDYGVALLSGAPRDWRPNATPGDTVVGDPVAWWRSLAEKARQLVSQVDLGAEVETPAGRRSVADGLSFPAIDLFVHGWDLARSAGIAVQLPDEAVEFAHSALDRIPAEQLRRPSVFAAEQTAPEETSTSERFLAWTGRSPDWQAAT